MTSLGYPVTCYAVLVCDNDSSENSNGITRLMDVFINVCVFVNRNKLVELNYYETAGFSSNVNVDTVHSNVKAHQ